MNKMNVDWLQIPTTEELKNSTQTMFDTENSLNAIFDGVDFNNPTKESIEGIIEREKLFKENMNRWKLQIEKVNKLGLPEEGKFVLLCFKEGKTCPHFRYQVGYLGTHDIEDNNFVKIGEKKVWYTNNYYYDFDQVIAWMPFPNYEE